MRQDPMKELKSNGTFYKFVPLAEGEIETTWLSKDEARALCQFADRQYINREIPEIDRVLDKLWRFVNDN